jgi:hypothetical protein
MAVGFARYSQDRSFVVLGENRSFVLVMAAGSIVGSFIGGLLLGWVPSRAAAPAGGDPGDFGRQGLAAPVGPATHTTAGVRKRLDGPRRSGGEGKGSARL